MEIALWFGQLYPPSTLSHVGKTNIHCLSLGAFICTHAQNISFLTEKPIMSLGSDANIKRKQQKKGTKMTGDENAMFDRHDTDESDEKREREQQQRGHFSFHSTADRFH